MFTLHVYVQQNETIVIGTMTSFSRYFKVLHAGVHWGVYTLFANDRRSLISLANARFSPWVYLQRMVVVHLQVSFW